MMAGNGAEIHAAALRTCKRCETEPATHDIRSETVCRECFCKYVETKVVKRLETFRVRHAEPGNPRKVLVALSLGTCSTAMLHILQQNIERQLARTGRSGYDLHMLYIRTQSTEDPYERWLDSLKSVYTRYEFSVLDSVNVSGSETSVKSNVNGSIKDKQPTPDGERNMLQDLLSEAASLTSQSDILNITLMRTIVDRAKTLGCESIVWGDSTTRLAEKILAETAKGRGSGLPYLISDGHSPFGIDFHYPMRDLLRKEVTAYAVARDLQIFKPSDPKSGRNTTISSKTMSIDRLMSDYFDSVEETYPSIVANVVRTSSKLDGKNDDSQKELCDICCMPVDKSAFGLANWKGNQSSAVSNDRSGICYACSRSTQLKS